MAARFFSIEEVTSSIPSTSLTISSGHALNFLNQKLLFIRFTPEHGKATLSEFTQKFLFPKYEIFARLPKVYSEEIPDIEKCSSSPLFPFQ